MERLGATGAGGEAAGKRQRETPQVPGQTPLSHAGLSAVCSETENAVLNAHPVRAGQNPGRNTFEVVQKPRRPTQPNGALK